MKKIISLLLILFCSNVANSGVSVMRTLLFEIGGKGLTKPSYILGTVHIICEDQFFFTNSYTKALKDCEQVCLEIDMDDPDFTMKSLKLMILPENKKLKDFFKEKEYIKLKKYMQEQQTLDIEMFATFKPLLLLSMLLERNYICEKTTSYEKKIIGMALEQKKEVVGLETVESQVAIFDNLPDSTVSSIIMEYVNDPEEQKKQTNQLIEAYLRKDLGALEKMIREEPDMKKNIDAFLYNRNKNWIEKMETLSKQKSTFYAVGAGHLGGEQGVLALLQKKGYTITPIHL